MLKETLFIVKEIFNIMFKYHKKNNKIINIHLTSLIINHN